jgi:molybdopterin-containing oxidoreductase family membrane subunit
MSPRPSQESDGWIEPDARSVAAINALSARPVLGGGWGWLWWAVLAAAAALTALLAAAVAYSFAIGPGVWGNNTSVVWGFPIANYVWWIALGSAGTLISSVLLLTRQPWRAAINRFAEAMTILAVAIAGLFPILHLGRPMYFYWTAPYPNSMGLWPQWRSALIWDFWAIVSYLLFSILFFYVGLLPDFAFLRDRARSKSVKRFYGVLALGWRGSLRHWAYYASLHRMLAAVAAPLVVSVHSIVGLDFAASLEPGWSESLFPPYFVAGALFSGFALVVLLTAALRRAARLHAVITLRHFDAMAKVILAASLIMALSYATEWFSAWYAGAPAEQRLLRFTFTGTYAPAYFAMLACNIAAPQIFWWPRARRSLPVLIGVSGLVLVGMYLERILIIANTLSHDYLPSAWRAYVPTGVDFAILAGACGFFVLLFMILARIVPVVATPELRRLAQAEASR